MLRDGVGEGSVDRDRLRGDRQPLARVETRHVEKILDQPVHAHRRAIASDAVWSRSSG